jgi:hypothetical protein
MTPVFLNPWTMQFLAEPYGGLDQQAYHLENIEFQLIPNALWAGITDK